MKYSIKSKIIATIIASAMVLPMALSACATSTTDSGDEWTITLNYNDGESRNNYIYVDKEEGNVKIPDAPVRAGYTFAGWYTQAEGGQEVDISTLTNSDSTVYAHWIKASYTISFNCNYGDGEIFDTATVEYGGKVTPPVDAPEREGYVFSYWATTAEGSTAVDFETFTVKKDVTFYARWRDASIEMYNVVLDYNNGTGEKAEYEVEQGDKISKSNANKATRKGYTLVGYASNADAQPTDADVIEIDDFPYTPTSSCTLYAVWEKTLYTASFRYNYYDNPVSSSNNAAVYERKTYYYQDVLTAPADPVRKGYKFDGWYTLATSNGVKVEFPLVTEDSGANYYAHWKSDDVYTDIFDAEYTEIDPTITWPGYSGGALGNACIVGADVGGVRVDNYPMNSQRPENKGFYVTYQYAKDSGLTFEFYVTEDITNATLIANWGVELAGEPGKENYMLFGPTGENAYEVALDGTPLNYTPANVGGQDTQVSGQFKSSFREYTLMTGLTLTKGKHTITLIPRNDNNAFGGVLTTVAPMTDYIRISYDGTGKLYWNPVYDNLDKKN